MALEASSAGAGRIVVRVRGEGGAITEIGVAANADAVSGRRCQRPEFLARIDRVRIVARRARHRARATAEQKIARLARADVAASGIARAMPGLPGERVAREKH